MSRRVLRLAISLLAHRLLERVVSVIALKDSQATTACSVGCNKVLKTIRGLLPLALGNKALMDPFLANFRASRLVRKVNRKAWIMLASKMV